jgi:hypothetical protein
VIVATRRIEHQPYERTWAREDYDLVPHLGGVIAPTLVIHGAISSSVHRRGDCRCDPAGVAAPAALPRSLRLHRPAR